MNSIKHFNRILNSDEYNRFEQWKNYRNELTNYILNNTENYIDSLLILGAGNCDDLDISRLNNSSNSLTISDIDKVSLIEALDKYDLVQENTKILAFDYTGLDSNLTWNNFIDNMIKAKDIKDIDYYFNKLNMAISNHKFPLTQKYDVVIVSPIYTQLIFQQGLSNINILHNLNFSFELLEHVKSKLLELMPLVINKFNENLTDILREKSTLIVVSDIFEANHNSIFYQETKGLKNIETVYENYLKNHGMGIGDYGLSNMSEKLKPIKSKWFEWPFNSDKTLFVKTTLFKQ